MDGSLAGRQPYQHRVVAPVAASANTAGKTQNFSKQPLVKLETIDQPKRGNVIVSNVIVHARPSSINNRSAASSQNETDLQPQSHCGLLKFNRHNQINFRRWSSQHATLNRDIDVRAAAAIPEPPVVDTDANEEDDGSEFNKIDREKLKKRRWELSRSKKRVSLQQKIDQAPIFLQLKVDVDVKREIKQEPAATIKQAEKQQPLKRRRFRGTREPDATNSAYYVFSRTQQGGWEAFPIENVFAFKPYQRSALNDEAVEEMFKRRDKVFNTFSHFATQRLAAAQNDEAESADALSALRISNVRAKTSATGAEDDMNTKVASARDKRRRARRGSDDEESDDGDDEGREVDYITDSDNDSTGGPASPTDGVAGDAVDEMAQMTGIDEEMAEDEADDENKSDEETGAEKAENAEGKNDSAEAEMQADQNGQHGVTSGPDKKVGSNKRRRPGDDENDDTMDDDDVDTDRPHRTSATAMIVGGGAADAASSDAMAVDDDDDIDTFVSAALNKSTNVDASASDGRPPVLTANAPVAGDAAGMASGSTPQPSYSSDDEKFLRNLLHKPLFTAQIMEKFSQYREKSGRKLTPQQVYRQVTELKKKLNVQTLDVAGGKTKYFIPRH